MPQDEHALVRRFLTALDELQALFRQHGEEERADLLRSLTKRLIEGDKLALDWLRINTTGRSPLAEFAHFRGGSRAIWEANMRVYFLAVSINSLSRRITGPMLRRVGLA
jgi:hypothetical protein